MNENKLLIQSFYEAFQKKDYETMQDSYANNAVFSDPVFKNLNADQVRSMWEMFCVTGKDLEIEFSQIKANEFTASAKWKATYTFSSTGRKIVNNIYAKFILEDGKIISHKDNFNFYWWLIQALGLTGLFLGWTKSVRNKVREKAMKGLNIYIKRKNR